MSTNLKLIAWLACLEFAGVLILAVGMAGFSSTTIWPFSGLGEQWSMPLIILGSLILLAGMAFAAKLAFSLSKSNSKTNNLR